MSSGGRARRASEVVRPACRAPRQPFRRAGEFGIVLNRNHAAEVNPRCAGAFYDPPGMFPGRHGEIVPQTWGRKRADEKEMALSCRTKQNPDCLSAKLS